MAQRNKPELLAPAGDLERLRAALDYGADAVYLGRESFSMRAAASNFHSAEQLHEAVTLAHQYGKKVYLTCNTLPRNEEIPMFPQFLQEAQDAGADALILADLGLLAMARKLAPDMEIHMSTQTGIVNYSTCRALYDMGVKRAVLARELSLEEIAGIRAKIPAEMELEVFVHGAMCMSYSGRCLISNFLADRSANQGKCAHCCRWHYRLHVRLKDGTVRDLNITPENRGMFEFLVKEDFRPGELYEIIEDEHGAYIMNSKDLRAIAHVERLTQMGVHSLKIEGRTKSFYYCARTAQVYRKAIDDAAAGKPFDTSLLETLEGLAHRGYTEGFLRRHTHDDYQNYEYGYSVSERQQFVGEFTGERNGPLAAVAVKNKFSVGDSLELMTPQGNVNFTLEHMENGKGETMPVAPGDGYTVWLPVPDDLPLQYALLMRNFTGQTTRNPHGN
mgnify:CR=1 FL=1